MAYVKLFESWLNEADDVKSPDVKKVLDSAGISGLIDNLVERAKSIGISEGKKRAEEIERTAKVTNGIWTAGSDEKGAGGFNPFRKATELATNFVQDLFPKDLASASISSQFVVNIAGLLSNIMQSNYAKESEKGWEMAGASKPSGISKNQTDFSERIESFKKSYGQQSKFYADLYNAVSANSIPNNIAGIIKSTGAPKKNFAPEEGGEDTTPKNVEPAPKK